MAGEGEQDRVYPVMGVDTCTIGGDQEMDTSLCPLSVSLITGAPNGTIY